MDHCLLSQVRLSPREIWGLLVWMKLDNVGAINVKNGLQKAVINGLLPSWEDISLSSSEDMPCSF